VRVTPVRVAIADDALLFREGLARILVGAGFEVVGQVGDAGALGTSSGVRIPTSR
jgi:hypothetical protein